MNLLQSAPLDTSPVPGTGLLLTVILITCLRIAIVRKSRKRHLRGPKLLSFKEARKKAKRYTKKHAKKDRSISWAGLHLPEKASLHHFVIVGATGSGKSVTIKRYMESILPLIVEGRKNRALIYDNKQDMYSFLQELGITCPIFSLNPFDTNGAAWDIASDIRSPATAFQAAIMLIPKNPHASQPFFDNAARHILSGVMISLNLLNESRWTLKDVLITLRSEEHIKRIISVSTETAYLLDYFSNHQTAQNVLSTLRSHMQPYEIVAAAWSHAKDSISLEDWANSSSILILGNDERARAALDAINQLIFKRISEILLSKAETDSQRTWLILDEVREAGKLDGLSSLLTRGRSKGVSVMLGFQDIEGLREVYGPRIANEMVGQCGNLGVLGLCSPETADWASRRFGELEVEEKQTSESRQVSSTPVLMKKSGETTSSRIRRELLILPSEFLHMASPASVGRVEGFFISPDIGAFKGETEFPERSSVESRISFRPAEEEYLTLEGKTATIPLLLDVRR